MALDTVARGLLANETARNRRLAVLASLRTSMARTGMRMPTLATILPTIGAPTSASSIATGTLHTPVTNPEKFWLTGGVWGVAGPAYPNNLAVVPVSVHPGNGTDPSIAAQGQGQRTCFVCWAPKLELYVLYGDANGGFRLKVDGEYVATGLKGNAGDGTANGSPRYVAVTWGDGSASHRKQRFYELEWASNGKFAGVRTENAYAVHPWRPADALRVLVHGDSMINTISDTAPQAGSLLLSLGTLSGSLLGQQDLWVSAIGGTGWYANLGGTASTFNQRVQLDVVTPAPDVIIELGGKNDAGQGTASEMHRFHDRANHVARWRSRGECHHCSRSQAGRRGEMAPQRRLHRQHRAGLGYGQRQAGCAAGRWQRRLV
jgi:hypothetical protein